MAFSHLHHAAPPVPHSTWLRLRWLAGVGLAMGLCLGAAHAQTEAQATQRAELPTAKTERITHEDGGSRVDELRVGGQTQRIDVTTKSGLPAYQIRPADGAQGPANAAGERSGLAGSPGRSSWRLVDF